jgi:S-adenosylmethionine:tRNA ribosyltransferase-isomerase
MGKSSNSHPWHGPVQPSSDMQPSSSDSGRLFTLADFDFTLPPELVAQHPAPERSGSRLLDGSGPAPVDRAFRDLPHLLNPGDLLVFNDTQVIKARLFGEKASGGKLELLVERVLPGHEVVAHMKVSKKPPVGATLAMAGGYTATLLGRWPEPDGALFHLRFSDEPHALMQRHGHVPLPPYITHTDTADDERRYQTVFARHPGAVAAPTAALHFDEGVLAALQARGVQRASVTLHVGAGTFQPVKTENLAEHTMHSEWYDVPEATRQAILALPRARRPGRGGRHHHRAHARILGPQLHRRRSFRWPDAGRHHDLHHAGLSLPGGRCAAHQLPPAQEHADDAGQRLCRLRARDGPVPPRHRAALPLLQLRRCHVAHADAEPAQSHSC